MSLQSLYNEYLNIKFNRGLQPGQTEGFEYGLYEDGGAELFFAGHDGGMDRRIAAERPPVKAHPDVFHEHG